MAKNAQEQALSEAARAQEHLVRQGLQQRNAPGVIDIEPVQPTQGAEVAYPVWYSLYISIHFSIQMR